LYNPEELKDKQIVRELLIRFTIDGNGFTFGRQATGGGRRVAAFSVFINPHPGLPPRGKEQRKNFSIFCFLKKHKFDL